MEFLNNEREAYYHSEGRYVFIEENPSELTERNNSGTRGATETPQEPYYEYYLKDHLGNVRARVADLDGSNKIEFNASSPKSDELLGSSHYYPFGMKWYTYYRSPSDQDYNWDGASHTKNKYGYNRKETLDNLGLNWQDYGARWYNPELGRFMNVDPMAEVAPGWSPYRYAFNNPLKYIDPNGMFESTHIDEVGSVIAEYDDGDDGVYVHNSGTTKKDIDGQRNEGANTGGDGIYIGELGGEIDATSIFQNLLNENGAESQSLFGESVSPLAEWVGKVKGGGDWDLKNNKKTIFGVAWSFDHSSKKSDSKTNFIFGEGMNGNAADLGNYHAGFTGTKAGIPMGMQKLGAGMVEQLKRGTFLKTMFTTNNYMSKPYGDAKRDYMYNVKGMNSAKK